MLVALKGALGGVCGSACRSVLVVICLKKTHREWGILLGVRVYWVSWFVRNTTEESVG